MDQQLQYAAGSEQKRLQPAGGNASVPSSKPPSASTSNNAPAGGAAAPPQPFDLNADPVLMQIQAQMASSNSQAQSAALSQEEQALLQLGDPALAKSILGGSDPMLAAISNNPESQYALLNRDYGQQLQQFGETIDPSLVNSGYRVQQEGQMAQALQDALAQAASGFQNQYQGIQNQLSQTEAANADTLAQAWSDAYNRAVQQALTNPPAAAPSDSPTTLKKAAASGPRQPKIKPRRKR